MKKNHGAFLKHCEIHLCLNVLTVSMTIVAEKVFSLMDSKVPSFPL